MNDEKNGIKIAILTSNGPQDRRSSWLGTISYMAQALQKQCGNVSYLGPLNAFPERLIASVLQRGSKFLLKKKFVSEECFLVAKGYARVAAQKLSEQAFDVIVAPAGASEIAFLETDIPIVIVADSTLALLLNYYPEFSKVSKRSVYEMLSIQQLAFKKASKILYSSTWAARSAIEDYYVDPCKVHVIPFGADMQPPPAKELVLQREKSKRCRLLFLGVDWRRKGGAIAFDTLVQLEKMGIQAELIVCGCIPPKGFSHESMTVIPFLDKNDAKQREELDKLFMTSDFLLLPTRSDCTPIVFCEANAFGLPVITTNTGGVPGVIRNGENGFMLPLDATGIEYAQVIAEIYQNDQRYAELIQSSRAAFDDRLNWDAWGAAVKKILAQLLDRESSYSDAQKS